MLKRIDKNNKEQLQSYLQSRSQEIESDILIKVSEIINEVRMKKDEALKKYTYQFDKIKVDTFKVTEEEIDTLCKAMKRSIIWDRRKGMCKYNN